MTYYFSKALENTSFESAKAKVTEELKKEGFGILTEIDFQKTLKEKIDADIKRYTILGACNPHFAYNAFMSEDKIGLMLPCNVIVEENGDGFVEVSAVDPVASMGAIENPDLGELAEIVRQKMQRVIANLKE